MSPQIFNKFYYFFNEEVSGYDKYPQTAPPPLTENNYKA